MGTNCTPLKQKTAKTNHVLFDFVSIRVHPPDIASTTRYRVPLLKCVYEYTGVDLRKKNRPTNVISIPHRGYVSLNGNS